MIHSGSFPTPSPYCGFVPRCVSAVAAAGPARRPGTAPYAGHPDNRWFFPQQLWAVIVSLLSKPDGGERPIALLCLLARVFERLCNPEVKSWELARAGFWDDATRGSSALRAGILRLLHDELSRFDGLCMASILWDIKKIYDTLSLEMLLPLAAALNYLAESWL